MKNKLVRWCQVTTFAFLKSSIVLVAGLAAFVDHAQDDEAVNTDTDTKQTQQ